MEIVHGAQLLMPHQQAVRKILGSVGSSRVALWFLYERVPQKLDASV